MGLTIPMRECRDVLRDRKLLFLLASGRLHRTENNYISILFSTFKRFIVENITKIKYTFMIVLFCVLSNRMSVRRNISHKNDLSYDRMERLIEIKKLSL